MNSVLENLVSAFEVRPVLRFFLFKCIVLLTVVVYYHARAVLSREDSSDKLSQLVFRAAHYQWSLPPAEKFTNTRH